MRTTNEEYILVQHCTKLCYEYYGRDVPKQCKTNTYFKPILIINYKTQTLMNKETQTPSNVY